MNHAEELNTEDMDLIAAAMRDSAGEDARLLAEASKDEEDPTPSAPAPAPVAEAPPPSLAPAAPATPAPTAAAPAAPAAPAPDTGGDLRIALRGARDAARKAQERADELQRQNTELLARAKTAPAADPTAISDEALETLKDYDKESYDAMMAMRAEVERLRAAAPAPTAPAKVFQPQAFNAETQDAIDAVPQLAAWHATEADQEKFEMAKRIDAINEIDPAWKGKPAAERFAAAVADVNRRFSATAPPAPPPPPKPKTLEEAQAIIAQLTQQPPMVRTGDLNGGTSPSHVEFDPDAMVRAGKTDEEIIAALART